MEITKCPCCKGEIVLLRNEGTLVGAFCKQCAFACDIQYLHQIQAAMELARAEAKMTKAIEDGAALDCARIDLFEAKRRVLEVFK